MSSLGLVCPCCGGDTDVKDSRPVPRSIRRRRHCAGCGHRFTTYEIPDSELRALHRLRDALQRFGPTLAELAATAEPGEDHSAAVAA